MSEAEHGIDIKFYRLVDEVRNETQISNLGHVAGVHLLLAHGLPPNCLDAI